nr:hypothetical protein [Sphingomonas mucosissima]
MLNQRQPVHARHLPIGDAHIERMMIKEADRLLRVSRGHHHAVQRFEFQSQIIEKQLIVVHREDHERPGGIGGPRRGERCYMIHFIRLFFPLALRKSWSDPALTP